MRRRRVIKIIAYFITLYFLSFPIFFVTIQGIPRLIISDYTEYYTESGGNNFDIWAFVNNDYLQFPILPFYVEYNREKVDNHICLINNFDLHKQVREVVLSELDITYADNVKQKIIYNTVLIEGKDLGFNSCKKLNLKFINKEKNMIIKVSGKVKYLDGGEKDFSYQTLWKYGKGIKFAHQTDYFTE